MIRALGWALAGSATTAAAAADPSLIVGATALDPATALITVDLIMINADAAPRRLRVAAAIDAALDSPAGDRAQVRLERAAGEPDALTLPPAGFARVRYRFTLPRATGPGLIALRLPGAPAVAIDNPANPTRLAQAAAPAASAPDLVPPRPPAADDRSASDFLANLSPYEPIYAVFGPGTDSEARLQLSLKYQFFGTGGRRAAWVDGLMFGYTQQMFWDVGRASSPFRDVSYMPELYYVLPRLAATDGWALGGRFGLRHHSNGRSGAASRSFNILYAEPQATTTLGAADLAVGARLWAYVGRRSDNPDIARYRGNAGLFARLGTRDGVQVDASGRLNPASGKGAAEALISYPLTGFFPTGPKLYLFGQGFVGYGEDLLDYNRRQTRVRAGVGIIR